MEKIISLLVCVLFLTLGCKTSKNSTKNNVKTITLDTLTVNGNKEAMLYMASETRDNDLLDTKLEVSFDWVNSYLLGKATVRIKPHMYPVKQVKLNAVGFDVKEVSLLLGTSKFKLNYIYDKKILTIDLDREYLRSDSYVLYIEYTAKPNELDAGGSAAITSDKGLYFINPLGKEKGKPQQVWTQGETQASSCWFPTIDAPNQRMTQEIFITTDKKFTTLSNGLLISQTNNADGTRTDHWKQNLPAAPYLSMMAVGDFAVVKDRWRDKEVNYYVDPAYAPYAKKIFGNTPQMLDFFSAKLGVEYPWEKYSQVVVHDYVSGAMENTSATLHGEFLQRTTKELLDNTNEDVISHELFHQWFGDLVTCESWSNLPLNESFATYGEYLWQEFKYGRAAADHHLQQDLQGYLAEASNKQVDMIRYYYEDKEDMFDSHSYAKGGRILHMLRKYVGDEAFFESLKIYLLKNRFTAVEMAQLRLAFEEVTGQDLNWFFNQWFFDKGHPIIKIQHQYIDSTKQEKITIEQLQDLNTTPLYRLPIDVDIYTGVDSRRQRIFLEKQKQDFFIPISVKTNLVNIDAEKMLLCKKIENKSVEEYIHQYNYAPLYLDHYEAIENIAKKTETLPAQETIIKALTDEYWNIRCLAIKNIDDLAKTNENIIKPILIKLVKEDEEANVRDAALNALSKYYSGDDITELYKMAVNDKAYSVQAKALMILKEKNPSIAFDAAKTLENDSNSTILVTIAYIYAEAASEAENAFFIRAFNYVKGFERNALSTYYVKYIVSKKDETINASLPTFEEIARNGGVWWMRYSGYDALFSIKNMYADREKESSSKLKANPALAEELQKIIDVSKAQQIKITSIIETLKKEEKSKDILKYLGN